MHLGQQQQAPPPQQQQQQQPSGAVQGGYRQLPPDECVKMNVCVFGPHKSGKSTLLGRLLLKCGCIDAATAAEVERVAKERRHLEYKYAWLTDLSKEEREGLTTVGGRDWCVQVRLSRKQRTLIAKVSDTPGHPKHVKHMISSLQGSHIGLLVVSAAEAHFENSIRPTAAASAELSLRDQLVIAYTTGVRDIVLCVTKMDHASVAFSKDRFYAIRDSMETFCRIIGIPNFTAIPVSGWTGETLARNPYYDTSPSPSRSSRTPRGSGQAHMTWYQGPSVMDAISRVAIAKKPLSQPSPVDHGLPSGGFSHVHFGKVSPQPASPAHNLSAQSILRLPIKKVHTGFSSDTVTLVGKIESGSVAVGDYIEVLYPVPELLSPRRVGSSVVKPKSDASAVAVRKVLSLEVFHTKVEAADVGDTVGLCVGVDGVDNFAQRLAEARSGIIMVGNHVGGSESSSSARYCQYFEAQVMILHTPGVPGVTVGYSPIVDVHISHTQCTLTDLILTFDRHTCNIIDASPTVLRSSSSAIIRCRPLTPLCVEPFHMCPSMGRVVLRDGPNLVGVGVIRYVKK